jgi:hypothetical protein
MWWGVSNDVLQVKIASFGLTANFNFTLLVGCRAIAPLADADTGFQIDGLALWECVLHRQEFGLRL